MGTLLQSVSKETADQGIKQQMKICAKTFQDARSVGAQEAVYRFLGLHLHKSGFHLVCHMKVYISLNPNIYFPILRMTKRMFCDRNRG